MIEINLIPDVKLELLKARKQRRMIISGSILLSLIAGGAVVLLSVYAFGVQTVAEAITDNSIKDESNKLSKVQDLAKTLTIQSQLDQLSTSESNKNITSRLFDVISATVPEGKNAVAIKKLTFDSVGGTISIEAEAANGYEALEVFKKTVAQTTFQYSLDGTAQDPVKIASNITDGNRSYGEDANGKQVLRFTVSFSYAEQLFKPQIQNGKVIGPDKQRATDSVEGVPTSLFSGSNS